MSDSTVHNLLMGTGKTVDNDLYGVVPYNPVEPLVVGREYTVSAYVEELVRTPLPIGVDRPVLSLYDGAGWWTGGSLSGDVPGVQTLTFTFKQPFPDHTDPNHLWLYNTPPKGTGVTRRTRLRNVMLVEGDTPAAWAPAEGETLAGGGALMSANLLDGVKPTPMSGTTEDGGVWHCPAKDGKYDRIAWSFSGMSALTANQTYHLGLSVKGASANASDLHMVIAYKDAAGNRNWAWSDAMPVGTEWSRSEATVVVPSGMTMTALTVSTNSSAKLPEVWLTSPTLSYGSPVTLASSAHTPYATQDHISATYATKASLKVTDDSIKAEVTARNAAIKAYQTDADGRIAAANSNASTAVSTAQTAASDAATAKTDAASAANTASNASKMAQDAKKTADKAQTTADAVDSRLDAVESDYVTDTTLAMTADGIRGEVARKVSVGSGGTVTDLSSVMEQSADGVLFKFSKTVGGATYQPAIELTTDTDYDDGRTVNSAIKMWESMSARAGGGDPVTEINGSTMRINKVVLVESLRVGGWVLRAVSDSSDGSELIEIRSV